MTTRFFLVFALILLISAPAGAQRVPRDCTLQRELIFDMVKAEYGAYNVWDAVYGEMNTDERFASAVVQESGNVVAVGEMTSFGKPDRVVQIVEFDHRGRVVWETAHPITGLQSVKKLLQVAEGFVVLGTVADKNSRFSVWLGFFDKQGNLTSQKTVAGGKESLSPEDLVPQWGGKGFVLSASLGEEKTGVFHAVLYHLDAKGNVTDDHAYRPGLDNRIFSLTPVEKNFYLASGYLRGEDGRIAGWLLKLNRDGSLMWQQQYPRGTSAQIARAVPMVGENLIAVGETKPAGGGNTAAWVMMVDSGGNLKWQRYYTGGMNQSGLDVIVNAEGMASVMMQATRPAGTEPDETNRDFVRLLTVNERGVLFISDEYFNAEGAQGFQMIGGRAGERIMTGRTDMVYKIEPKPGEPVETLKHGWDAWVVAAAPMESFSDPCLNINPFGP